MHFSEAAEINQRLRDSCAALVEDLCLIPSKHVALSKCL